MKKPVILMILDGFGIAPEKGNAIKAAKKPNIDKLFASNPLTQIGASGMDVSLDRDSATRFNFFDPA